jgi:endo-1,4-beta-xylanase
MAELQRGVWGVRPLFAPFAFALTTLLACSPSPSEAQDPALLANHTKFLGNVWSGQQLQDFTRYWNQVTPENAGKWGSMAPSRDQINWGQIDTAYRFAKDNGYIFRFHVLVWGNQQPTWIETLSREEQLAEVRKRFQGVAARYPEIDYLEVVNEPLNDPPRKRNENDQNAGDYFEALGGEGASGWDWVLTSFRMAREIFPASTKLVINEYNIVNNPGSTDRYLGLINLLKAEDLIDVIGVQGHAFSLNGEPSVIRGNLDRLAATGLPIMVTELDVDGLEDAVQLANYQRVFPIFWDHPSVIGVTLWGWRPGMWRTQQGAPLVRADGTHRPSFDWLLQYTGRTPAAQ